MTPRIEINIERVRSLVIGTLPHPASSSADGVIFGSGGALDSLGLVSFLADLEYKLGEEFGREIVLASEQAMSRSRSPFRDVASLSDYIVELLAQ